jgi:hypothetical protein
MLGRDEVFRCGPECKTGERPARKKRELKHINLTDARIGVRGVCVLPKMFTSL